MLKDLIKKENEFASQIIASYENEIKKVENDISYVEEKYKKLAEEESKNLKSELDELNKRLGQWKAAVVPALSDNDESELPVEKEEAEPVITDTLFPENNDTETVEEKPAEEETTLEPAVEDEKIFEYAAEEELPEEELPDVTEDGTPVLDLDDGFPAKPEEW